MNIRVVREPTVSGTTLGCVFVNGHFFAFSLEDEVRERVGIPVSEWKLQDKTAIPTGRYRVKVTWSERFQRQLPLLLDVPGFSGIRIHAGNTSADTSGCLLLGVRRASVQLVESRPAVTALQRQIEDAIELGEEVWIELENPRP
jgi:hypothetical protein